LSIALKGSVHFHYCGHALKSVSLFGDHEGFCSCDSGEHKSHRCHDEAYALDIDGMDCDENDEADDLDASEHLPFFVHHFVKNRSIGAFSKQKKQLDQASVVATSLPKYIQYCSYLI
jgi:hypothetical protein